MTGQNMTLLDRADDLLGAWLVEELLLVHQKSHAEHENNDQQAKLPPDSPQRKKTKEDDLFRSCFIEIVT